MRDEVFIGVNLGDIRNDGELEYLLSVFVKFNALHEDIETVEEFLEFKQSSVADSAVAAEPRAEWTDQARRHIDAALVDSETYHCYYLVINLGGFLQVRGKTVILPVEICEVVDLGKVKTEWRKESMLGSPTPTETMNITAIEEELIREYYGLPPQRPCPLKIQKK
jgi:hypothetical protein